MANYPQVLAQDAVCQSHTGHMTGLWFLPTRPLRLNTNEWIHKHTHIIQFNACEMLIITSSSLQHAWHLLNVIKYRFQSVSINRRHRKADETVSARLTYCLYCRQAYGCIESSSTHSPVSSAGWQTCQAQCNVYLFWCRIHLWFRYVGGFVRKVDDVTAYLAAQPSRLRAHHRNKLSLRVYCCCCRCILHLQQYSRRLNLFFLLLSGDRDQPQCTHNVDGFQV